MCGASLQTIDKVLNPALMAEGETDHVYSDALYMGMYITQFTGTSSTCHVLCY